MEPESNSQSLISPFALNYIQISRSQLLIRYGYVSIEQLVQLIVIFQFPTVLVDTAYQGLQ